MCIQQSESMELTLNKQSPNIDESSFIQVEWGGFYQTVKEEMPPNMPAGGNFVMISCLAGADHAGNVLTRRSHAGILVFVNNAFISWFFEAPEHSGVFHFWGLVCGVVNCAGVAEGTQIQVVDVWSSD